MKQYPCPLYLNSVLLLLIIISAACISTLDPRYFNSEYSYEIGITHSGPLSNATFIIPLAVKGNVTGIASEIYTESDFNYNNVTVSLTQAPPELDLSEAIPITGYEPWFLIIRTDSPVSDAAPYFIFHFEKDIHVKLDNPDFRVNTLLPIGNETLIPPKFHFILPNISRVANQDIDRVVYETTKVPYSTPIYLDYSAPSSTHLEIYCIVRGANYWRQYDDSGGRNQDLDGYSKILSGDAHGWYTANGELVMADGFYPNFDHPEWQMVMNQSV